MTPRYTTFSPFPKPQTPEPAAKHLQNVSPLPLTFYCIDRRSEHAVAALRHSIDVGLAACPCVKNAAVYLFCDVMATLLNVYCTHRTEKNHLNIVTNAARWN